MELLTYFDSMTDWVGNLDLSLSCPSDSKGRKPTLVENYLQRYFLPYYLILLRN
jgi:hypothetical protein